MASSHQGTADSLVTALNQSPGNGSGRWQPCWAWGSPVTNRCSQHPREVHGYPKSVAWSIPIYLFTYLTQGHLLVTIPHTETEKLTQLHLLSRTRTQEIPPPVFLSIFYLVAHKQTNFLKGYICTLCKHAWEHSVEHHSSVRQWRHAQGVGAGRAVRPVSSLGAVTIQWSSTRGITLPNNAQWLLGCHSGPLRPLVAELGCTDMHRHHSMGLSLEMCLPLQPTPRAKPRQGTATATAYPGPLLWDKCHPEDTRCLRKTDNIEQNTIYTDKESLAEEKP